MNTDNDFEVVASGPEDVNIALWTMFHQYMGRVWKLKNSWWADKGEALKFIKKLREALNEEIDCELPQSSAQGSRDGLHR